MRHSAHISIPIAVLQIVVVILGVFIMRLAFLGMEDSVMDHPRFRLALLIRNHGYLLLAVPMVWTALVLWLENRPGERWSRWWTIASGLVVLVALSIFLHETCSSTYWRLMN